MTREEAIKSLKVLRKDFSGYKPNEEVFDMAIKALEREQCADVVEWEKIDKAIKEMERYSTSFEYANRHDLASAVDCCIGMIQKNIGESK